MKDELKQQAGKSRSRHPKRWDIPSKISLRGAVLTLRRSSLARIMIAAMFADNDPDPAQHSSVVPGANDGASGVAVLLELARSLPEGNSPGLARLLRRGRQWSHRRVGLDPRVA